MVLSVVGHRGAIAEAPENTIAGFRAAEALGLGEIETDVRISADGELCLLHDADLDRVASGTRGGESLGPILGLTLAEIRSVDLGGGERVPTLLEMYESTSVQVQLEIKALEAIDALTAFFGEHRDYADRTILSSFSIGAMEQAAAAVPYVRRGVIVSGWTAAQSFPGGYQGLMHTTGSSRVHCGWDGLTAAAVDELHAAGYEVHGWPGLSVEDYARGHDLGIDGMCSDDPRALLTWLAEQESSA